MSILKFGTTKSTAPTKVIGIENEFSSQEAYCMVT